MDFAWTDEQQELQDGARKFAAEALEPGADARDRNKAFSRELWRTCADFGLQGMPVPEAYGGGGHDPLSMVAILEGVGQGCSDNGLVFSVGAHLWACTMPILLFGTEAQKQRWLPGMVDGSLVAANGMTEADSGSNAYALRTTARKEGDHYVLDGAKVFVTNAPVADLFVVYARTGGKAGFAGITGFVVDKGTPGLSLGQRFHKMGLRASPMAEVVLDGCRVPADNVLGREGSGSMVFNMSMEWERLMILAPALGAMRRVVDRVVAHARQRKVGETPISKHQSCAHRLVNMELTLRSARLVLLQAAWRKAQEGQAMAESAMAKVTVSEAYVTICREAMQLYGGYGYMEDTQVERELRDALASTLYSGTSEVQRNIIAALTGL